MKYLGNEKSLKLLSNSLSRGAVNHAYLFSGPEAVGKYTLARLFALNIIEGQPLELDQAKINKDAQLDLHLVEPVVVEKNGVSKQREITVETIRDIKQKLSLFPYRGKYKVLIIKDAHRLNTGAQNALLKILEEPSPTTVLILVTHELNRILPTIISRCQQINFTLVSETQMLRGGLEADSVTLAQGRPGVAYEIERNTQEKQLRLEAKRQFDGLAGVGLHERFQLAEELAKNVVTCSKKLNVWIWEYRKQLVENHQNASAAAGITKIQEAIAKLKNSNANARLVLETLLMDL